MATVQKRRNGRRNNQEETPNKLKRKNSKILEHVTQDETPVSNVVVPIKEENKPLSNGISSTSPPSPKLQKEQASTPTVTSSKKSTTPRKRKAKSEEITSDIKTETILADQPVMKEDEQSVTAIKKEKRKRNRVLPSRGKKVNNDSLQSQTQLQPTTQPQNEMKQEQQTPPPQQPQPEKSTSSIQISQKTRSPSTQKRKVKALAITGLGVKEKSLDNVTPATSLEEVSTPVLNEPKEVLKEEQKEISETRKSQKKKARLIIKQKRKRIIKSKETISSGDDDLEDEYIPNDIIKVTTTNETPRPSFSSHTKPSKKRNITNGMDNNKDLKARITRQRTKSTNKGKTRGRKKIIRLDDEETERNINKVSDAETIQNDIDEKRDQTSNHASDNRQVIENNEQDREQTEDVDLPFGGRLTADEADTSRTRPDNYDKVRFENAKNKAEAVCIPYMLTLLYIDLIFFPFYFLGYATKTRGYL